MPTANALPPAARERHRSRWMAAGRVCMAEGDWQGAVRAYGQGLWEQPRLGLHYLANLERARQRHRRQRQMVNARGPAGTAVAVVSSQLGSNAAGRAFTLAELYRDLGHPVVLVGSHFPDQGRELWEPIRTAVQQLGVGVHSVVVEDEAAFLGQAWQLVLQHPADRVHLSKPRLPAVMVGLLYKLLWDAQVLVDIDDEELCFVGEQEPITVDALKRLCHGLPEPKQLMGPLWTRLAVDLAQRFDGITVANRPLQERYGGTVIPHARDPARLKPATAEEKRAARERYGVPQDARVVLFFGTPRRHKGLLQVGKAVAALPEDLQPMFVVAGAFPAGDPALEQELRTLVPDQRLRLLGNQPWEAAACVLALADLVVLLNEGAVAAFQSPAKLSDALAMGLPVLVSDAAPLRELADRGWVVEIQLGDLVEHLHEWLGNPDALASQGGRALAGFTDAIALRLVAERMAEHTATTTDLSGQQLATLESLAPDQASPLLAHRYLQWSRRQIDWAALQQQQRDEELVSIVVPVYGDPAELDGCLHAVRQASTKHRWELIAVMNDESPESQTVLENHQQTDLRIRAVWPGENVQFALGCNLGFAASGGAYLVVLNNDCRVQNGWLEALLEPLGDETVAAVQPRLLKPDGTVQCLGVVFRQGQTLGYPLYAGLNGSLAVCRKEQRLQAVTGACLAIRAADFAVTKGFDAGFINSQEDVDLCLRLLRLPGRFYCLSTPLTTVVHVEGVSPGRFKHAWWSRLRFVWRWRGIVRGDDTMIYESDGIRVRGWQEDGERFGNAGIGAGRAVVHHVQSKKECAIIVHIFYLDLWPEIRQRLMALSLDFDLHVTCCPSFFSIIRDLVQADFPKAETHVFPNTGMDILPFLRLVPVLREQGYSCACKLHTKRGVEPYGSVWRRHLLDSLIGAGDSVQNVLEAFRENPDLVMAGSSRLYVSAKIAMYNNKASLERIHNVLFPGSEMPDDWGFFAGSMFWFRVNALTHLASTVEMISGENWDSRDEESNGDGGLVHAIERALAWSARNKQIGLLECVDGSHQKSGSQIYIIKHVFSTAEAAHIQRSHLTPILKSL